MFSKIRKQSESTKRQEKQTPIVTFRFPDARQNLRFPLLGLADITWVSGGKMV